MKRLLVTCLLLLTAFVAQPPTAAAEPVAEGGSLPFVEGDYAAALAEARARRVPIFVDAWAPW